MKVKAFAKRVLGIQYNDEKYDSARRCYRKIRDRQRLHNGVFPSSFILETCTYCNALCDYCRRTKMVADGRLKPSIMSMDFYGTVINELAKLDKPRTLSFVGLGDWLLDPYIHERLKMAHQRLGGWTFSTITNGIALTSNVQKELVNNLDSIVISLNIFDRELYSKYNGVDKFDLVVEQTKAFLALKGDSKPSVKIQLLLTDQMKPLTKSFVDYWKPFLNKNDEVILHGFLKSAAGDSGTTKYVQKPKQPRFHPCFLPWELMVISVDGNVYPCCLGEVSPSLKVGNISEGIVNLLESEVVAKFREAQLSGDTPFICRSCDFWVKQPNPWFHIAGKWR